MNTHVSFCVAAESQRSILCGEIACTKVKIRFCTKQLRHTVDIMMHLASRTKKNAL